MSDIEIIFTTICLVIILRIIYAGFTGGSDSSPSNAYQLKRLEKKLDLILQNLGIEFKEPPVDGVTELLIAGNKIGAIKKYREQHPEFGLKEAKDAVEMMAKDLGI